MPDNENPYDEFLKNLAKLVEEIVRNMPDGENARFIGCTIIAGGSNGTPNIPGNIPADTKEIRYEIIESEDRIFITADVPPDTKNAAYADINPDSVRISMGEREARIPLSEQIDVIHSFYMVRHGVLDIVLKKGTCATYMR